MQAQNSSGKPTIDQSKDTGMAMVLILLLLTLAFKRNYLVYCAIGVLALTMIRPQLFRPLAVVWFGFSHVLGMVTSRIVLTIIFFIVVTPVGVARKMFGVDALKLSLFKKGRGSVMETRNHKFCAEDVVKPY